jgi:hypothetical protein
MPVQNYNKKYDVLVAGGGVAGVAAAVTAARAGAKTALIEKSCTLGGLATNGLINIYLPLCDGNGTQVTYGFAEELMLRSLEYGPGSIPLDWEKKKNASEVERYRCVFAPASMALAMDELLLESGVEVWLDSLITEVECDDEDITKAIFVENTDGRIKIAADVFVDATGSAHIAKLAGAELFYEKNYLSLWALEYEGKVKAGIDRMMPEINMLTNGDTKRLFSNPTAKDVSSYMLETRAILRKFYKNEYAENNYDRFNRWPLMLPGMPQFRKIAAIKGRFILKDGMFNQELPNSIGLAADWRKSGFVWEIPFGAILPQKVKGLLVAGRCVSAIGDALEISRVIPTAALTGEAAGNAAAMAACKKITPDQLSFEKVQAILRKDGRPLNLRELRLN